MKHMFIIEITEGAEFDQMPEALQKAIQGLGVEWDLSVLSGTSPVAGKQLILVQSSVDAVILTEAMNNDVFDDNDVQIGFDLGWSIVADNSEAIDQSLLLPYFDDVITYDENGDILSTTPVTDLNNKLPVFSGKKWKW